MSDDAAVSILQAAKERVAEAWWGGGDLWNGWCAAQAIYHQDLAWYRRYSNLDTSPVNVALHALRRVVAPGADPQLEPINVIADWNDAPGRTVADVLDAMDAAMRLVKAQP